jgi:hypothetical protein
MESLRLLIGQNASRSFLNPNTPPSVLEKGSILQAVAVFFGPTQRQKEMEAKHAQEARALLRQKTVYSCEEGSSLLMAAAARGNMEGLRTLIADGFCIEAKDWQENKAYDYALENGQFDALATLLAPKAKDPVIIEIYHQKLLYWGQIFPCAIYLLNNEKGMDENKHLCLRNLVLGVSEPLQEKFLEEEAMLILHKRIATTSCCLKQWKLAALYTQIEQGDAQLLETDEILGRHEAAHVSYVISFASEETLKILFTCDLSTCDWSRPAGYFLRQMSLDFRRLGYSPSTNHFRVFRYFLKVHEFNLELINAHIKQLMHLLISGEENLSLIVSSFLQEKALPLKKLLEAVDYKYYAIDEGMHNWLKFFQDSDPDIVEDFLRKKINEFEMTASAYQISNTENLLKAFQTKFKQNKKNLLVKSASKKSNHNKVGSEPGHDE